MKTLTQNTLKGIGLAAATAMLMSGCGGGGGTNWGIDHGKSLPKCASDSRDSSAAVSVPAGAKITALEKGTTIRVWHYSNSDKLVCTITGSAVINGE